MAAHAMGAAAAIKIHVAQSGTKGNSKPGTRTTSYRFAQRITLRMSAIVASSVSPERWLIHRLAGSSSSRGATSCLFTWESLTPREKLM